MRDLLLLIKELFVLLTFVSIFVILAGAVVLFFDTDTAYNMMDAGVKSTATSAMIALFSAAWAEAYKKTKENEETSDE